MICGLTGVVPTDPVLSPKSGVVFERRAIEKHLEHTGTDPVNGADLKKDELIAVKTSTVVAPRPAGLTSIPSVLQVMQSEWDSLMLETYSLKQHLHLVRQELAQALYRNDAANRVIARLIQERDQARSVLRDQGIPASQSAAPSASAGPTAMDADASSSALSQQIQQRLTDVAADLSKPRRKRIKQLAAEVTPADALAKFALLSTHPLHNTQKPGITCLDLHSVQEDLTVTGGADGNAIVFNRSTGKIEDTLKAHKKKINDVKFHNRTDTVFTASADSTSTVWRRNGGKYAPVHTLSQHSDEVVGCSVHPSGDYFVTASHDSTWNFYDVETGSLYATVEEEKKAGYSCVSFHPDGMILGVGTKDGFIRVYDAKSQKQAAAFSEDHSGEITAISFSENGYYLASADSVGAVKLWDLRKLANFHSIAPSASQAAKALAFDPSGTYLAVGAADLRVYDSTSWNTVKVFADHKAEVTGVRFGSKASFIASVSRDRNLKFFGSA